MSALPDEIWRWVFELGVKRSILSYKDVCCVSMSCRRLNRLSNEPTVWSSLLSSDFPIRPSSLTHDPPPKSLYQIRFEKDKVKKLLAERRSVLRIESQIHEHTRKMHEIDVRLAEENEKIKAAAFELSDLRKVREASAALKVWQPAVVRSRQKAMVECCSVPVEARINVLEMEIKLCKQQISGFVKASRDENGRLEAAKSRLSKVKYRSLEGLEGGSRNGLDGEARDGGTDLKKLKRMKHK